MVDRLTSEASNTDYECSDLMGIDRRTFVAQSISKALKNAAACSLPFVFQGHIPVPKTVPKDTERLQGMIPHLSSLPPETNLLNRVIRAGKHNAPVGVFLDDEHIRIHIAGYDYVVTEIKDPDGKTLKLESKDLSVVEAGKHWTTITLKTGQEKGSITAEASALFGTVKTSATLNEGCIDEALTSFAIHHDIIDPPSSDVSLTCHMPLLTLKRTFYADRGNCMIEVTIKKLEEQAILAAK